VKDVSARKGKFVFRVLPLSLEWVTTRSSKRALDQSDLLKTAIHDEVVKPSEALKPPPQAVQTPLCGEIAVEVLDLLLEELPEEPLDR